MNKYVNDFLKNDPEFGKQIQSVSQHWFRKYKGQYNRVNLCEVEDLEQEIWAELLESNLVEKEDMLCEADRIADKHRKQGGRLPVEIPVSQLDKDERITVNNLFYSDGGEDDYSEKSFP